SRLGSSSTSRIRALSDMSGTFEAVERELLLELLQRVELPLERFAPLALGIELRLDGSELLGELLVAIARFGQKPRERLVFRRGVNALAEKVIKQLREIDVLGLVKRIALNDVAQEARG